MSIARNSLVVAFAAMAAVSLRLGAQDHKATDLVVVRTADGSQIRGRFEDSLLGFAGSAGRLSILTRRIEGFDSSGLRLTDHTLLKGAFVTATLRIRSAAGLVPILTKQVSAIERVDAGPTPGATARIPQSVSGTPARLPERQPFQAPTAYGWYANIAGTRAALPISDVKTVLGIRFRREPSRGMALDGFAADPSTRFNTGAVSFVVYQQGLQAASVHLALLGYIPNILAGSFDPKGDPLTFEVIYDKKKTDVISVDLWRSVAE
ncbi:MAG: hypothetical protein ACRELE_08600, partial [Gemmatimonadales bacterium]